VEAAQSTVSSARRVKQTYAADDPTPLSLFPLKTLWTQPLNSSLTAPPAFDGARGFFPLENDQLAAYNLVKGTRLWTARVRTSSQPAAGDNLLFVVTPGSLAALRAADGSSAWELPFSETLAVPLVWDSGWLIAVTTTGDVLAFRATDGALIWRRSIGAAAHARPALAIDRLYVPTTDDCGPLTTDPISDRGLAAVRVNYPYQAATLSAFRPSAPTAIDPIPPNVANFIVAEDGSVSQVGDAPGTPIDDGAATGAYAGAYGLGRQFALAGRTVRPFRKLISAQAVYRREVVE